VIPPGELRHIAQGVRVFRENGRVFAVARLVLAAQGFPVPAAHHRDDLLAWIRSRRPAPSLRDLSRRPRSRFRHAAGVDSPAAAAEHVWRSARTTEETGYADVDIGPIERWNLSDPTGRVGADRYLDALSRQGLDSSDIAPVAPPDPEETVAAVMEATDDELGEALRAGAEFAYAPERRRNYMAFGFSGKPDQNAITYALGILVRRMNEDAKVEILLK
jgi:hypothetical protein